MKNSFFRFLVFLLVIPVIIHAQQTTQRGMKPVQITVEGNTTVLYSQSHALVIGVSAYNAGLPPLQGVVQDVNAVRSALEENGFDVTTVMDPDNAGLQKAFTNFITRYGQENNNRLLIYFAGHGYTEKMPYGDDLGYICPVDAPDPNKNPAGFQEKAMPMRQIETYAYQIKSKHALFLFDACFSGSIFSTSRAIPEVISYKTKEPVRQFIASGSANETVPDKSIFTGQFVRALKGEADGNKDGYLTGTELGEFLQSTVVNYSYGAQHPQYGKIRNPNLDKGDFVFVLAGKSVTSFPPVAPSTIEESRTGASSLIAEMVFVHGGTFQMGSNSRGNDEKPFHSVTISNYYIGKYEVTQKLWRDVMGNDPPELSFKGCDQCPVEKVSWNDIQEFLQKLNLKTGKNYRLPTEAEWEYAARGGNQSKGYIYSGSNTIDEIAWYGSNSGSKTHPVGQKHPNELGLYDMTGNVWEWCSDWYGDTYYKSSPMDNPKGPSIGTSRSLRGGSWFYGPNFCRTGKRGKNNPDDRHSGCGFRLCTSE